MHQPAQAQTTKPAPFPCAALCFLNVFSTLLANPCFPLAPLSSSILLTTLTKWLDPQLPTVNVQLCKERDLDVAAKYQITQAGKVSTPRVLQCFISKAV